MTYNWTIYPRKEIPQELLDLSQGDTLVARLLINRGVTSHKTAKYFLAIDQVIETDAYEIPDLDKAINRINRALEQKEKITIFGDYDVDGTSSTALLIRAFRMIGYEANYYIPSRHHEGYGLNNEAIKKIKEELGTDLLITCDCGISNYKEVDYANSLGLDVIITDHHSIPTITPNSVANCNPKTLAEDHPLHYLPGVGVAYKLAEKLLETNTSSGDCFANARNDADSLLDLVALGMIADMAALKAENRYLTIKGLEVLSQTNKAGLRALLFSSGVNGSADSEHIGFGLAPRINAAGRLADANRAVELMITEDPIRAQELCEELNSDNQERQNLCKLITEEALALLAQSPDHYENNCIALAQEDWHHGVIGIVASRLLDAFHLPVFVMAKDNDITKGSVRCINLPGLDIFEEMSEIQRQTNLFSKFGGHKMAAGFSCQAADTEALISAIKKHFRNRLANQELTKQIKIDAAIKLKELNSQFLDRISKLAPFGIENPSALFACPEVTLERTRLLGKDGQHLKLFLREEGANKIYEALLWNRAEEFLEEFKIGEKHKICFVFSPKINEFNGETSIQLEIKDWKRSKDVDPSIFERFTQNSLIKK